MSVILHVKVTVLRMGEESGNVGFSSGTSNEMEAPMAKPKAKKSKKVLTVQNFIDVKYDSIDGFYWILTESGGRMEWCRSDQGRPKASVELYLKAFLSGVNLGSGSLLANEDPDPMPQTEEDGTEQDVFYVPEEVHIEGIIAKRGVIGEEEYLVKWIGVSGDDTTWRSKGSLDFSRTFVRIFESGVEKGSALLAEANSEIDKIIGI